MKVDFTIDGTTSFTTLRDTTCDIDRRATGCSLFAGPADPSEFLGVSDAAGAFPTTHTSFGAPEMVLSPVSGGGSVVSGGAADAVGTIKMKIADFDNDGNPDIIYGTNSQEAARVSLARPWNTARTSQTQALANEHSFGELTSDVVVELKEVENNMLNMLDAMLLGAPTVTVHDSLDGVGPGGTAEDSYGYVNRGEITQNGNTRTEYNANTQPVVYPDIDTGELRNSYVTNGVHAADRNTEYDAPAGDPDLTSNSTAAGVSDATCRAPSESVLPMTVSLQVDFPTVPCVEQDFSDCILLDPIYASKQIVPTPSGNTVPSCGIVVNQCARKPLFSPRLRFSCVSLLFFVCAASGVSLPSSCQALRPRRLRPRRHPRRRPPRRRRP